MRRFLAVFAFALVVGGSALAADAPLSVEQWLKSWDQVGITQSTTPPTQTMVDVAYRAIDEAAAKAASMGHVGVIPPSVGVMPGNAPGPVGTTIIAPSVDVIRW